MNFFKIQNFFLFLTLFLITISFFWLLQNFAFSIFFAIVLTIVAYPMYDKILRFTKNKENLSSGVAVLMVLLLIITPLVLTSSLVVKESTEVYKSLSVNNSQSEMVIEKYEVEIKKSVESMGFEYSEIKVKTIGFFKKSMNYVLKQGLSIGKDAFSLVISFLLTMYIMFYLFRDGKKFLRKLSKILPLGDDNEKKAFNKFSLIIKSIFKGSLIVALVQGIMGGLLFYFVGIKAVFLWTVLMVILSIIPALGPVVIIIPAIIFMVLSGNTVSAIILSIGAVVISISDNILRPIFIGNSIKMHDLILTLSILGGIGVFGILGFIVGPVIAGLFILAWELFEERYEKQLENNG